MNERKNPLDLGDFAPKAASTEKHRPEPEIVSAVAAETGFLSRQPVPEGAGQALTSEKPAPRNRRHRTGRNIQRNIKIDANTAKALDEEADTLQITFGEVMARGIAAIRKLREMDVKDY